MTEEEFRRRGFDDSKKAAEAIQADASLGFDYVAEANLTLSPAFHGDKVSRAAWTHTLNDCIGALTHLDKIKKSLFYGRDNNLITEGQSNVQTLPYLMAKNMPLVDGIPQASDAEIIIHGIVGMATECGELLELLRDTINGNTFDPVNLKEEIGDTKWYMAILAKVAGFEWGDDERTNIAKLRARFPDRFTEYDANNRNLSVERDILEGETPFVTFGDTYISHASLSEETGKSDFTTRNIGDSDGTDGA